MGVTCKTVSDRIETKTEWPLFKTVKRRLQISPVEQHQ